MGQASTGSHPPSCQSFIASSCPQLEQISVLLSARDMAPGYLPGVSLLGIRFDSQRGHSKFSTFLLWFSADPTCVNIETYFSVFAKNAPTGGFDSRVGVLQSG